MEPWQKQFILSRLETLVPATTCSTNLLSTLKASYILDKDDIDRLDMIRNEFGETEQVNAFYAIIMSKTGAYVLLIEALLEFNQHIPAKILKEAYAANNGPCPLMPKKSDHSTQTNKPLQSITFSRKIFVQGKETTLQSFFQRFTKSTSKPHLSHLLDSESRRLINKSNFNLITVNIPPLTTKYSYLQRRVFQRIFLIPTVISVPNSIFVLQGISKDKVHQFICDADIYTYSAARNIILSTDTSAVIILADENEMVDFDYVRKHTSGTQSIHHLSWNGTRFRWHLSSSGVGALADHYSEATKKITETDFLKELISGPRKPVCLSGSPGSGKSVFMLQIAYHLLDNSEDLVFYFQFTEFLHFLPKSIDDITTNAIKNALAATHTSTRFAHAVLQDVLDNNTNEVTLLLDDYDRVHENHMPAAFKAIAVIREDMRNIRLIISTRSGLSGDLGNCLDTFCIALSPLSDQQKLDLIVDVWEKHLSEFTRSKQIDKFANRCLAAMDNIIRCKGQECNITEDIATPIYCEHLAELNLSNAAGFIDSDFLDGEPTQLSSIHDLMHRIIQSRFLNVGESHLSHSISAIPVQTVREVHILASIAVLFPTYLKTFESILGFSHKKYLQLKSVLSPGVLTKNTFTGEISFSSTIFAQYLIAEFITEVITEQNFCRTPEHVAHIMNFVLKDVLCCYKTPALKYIKKLNNFDCTGISAFRNIEIVRILDWFLLQDDIRKIPDGINLDVVNKVFQNHIVVILEASAKDNLLGVAKLFLEALWQNNVQIFIPSSLLTTSAMISSYQYNLLLYNYLGNGNINVTEADSCVSPLQAVVQRGDYNIFKEMISHTACKMKHDLLHRCVKGSNDNPDRVIADKIKIINELLGMENTEGIISERVDGLTPILQSGIHLQLLHHLLNNGSNVNDINDTGETILDVYLVKGMNTKVPTQDLNVFLQLIHSQGFNWKANRNSGLEPLLCAAFDKAVLNVESVRYFTDGGFDLLSKNAAGENPVFVAIKKHQGVDILEHLISQAYEHMDWHTDLNLTGETMLHVAVETEHISAVKFLLTAISSSKNITNLPRNDGNTALHLNLLQKSSSAEQILHMLMQAGANLSATNLQNLTPLELGLQSGNFTMITKSLTHKLQNEYKYDLRHNAERLLASIITRIDTTTELSTTPADREVFQYIMQEWEKTQSILVFDSFNVNYNGITKRLDNILSNAEKKNLLKYVFQNRSNLDAFLEFWNLAHSAQPTIVLLKENIPLPPRLYQNRTVRLNDNKTDSKHPGRILTEDQLVLRLDENNNDIICIISDSVGVTSFIHSISRKIQMNCFDNIGIYIDPCKFPRTWQRDNKTLSEYISERIAATPLSAKILQMIFQNDTRLDIYIDGSRFQDIFVTSLQEEFLAQAASTIKFARIFVASCVPLKMTQLNPLKTPLQIEVLEFNMEDLTSLMTNIWNTNSVSNNPSLAEVQAKQYLDCIQLALNHDISTISQYILYINYAQEIANGGEDNDIFSFVFRSLQYIATMGNGEPICFKNSMAVKETNFPGTFTATKNSFVGFLEKKYTSAKALFNSAPLNPDTKCDIETYQDLFETVEGTSLSNPSDLGPFLPTFRLAFSPIRTFLFRNYTVLFFLDAMLVLNESSQKIDCLQIAIFTDHCLYEIIMACILLRLEGLLNDFLLQLVKKNTTDNNTLIFEQNPLSHLMIVAAKYASSITIEKLIATFPTITQSFSGLLHGDELTPLHVAAQTGNAEGFICFHKNLNASNNTTYILHTLLFNSWSDTDYIINEKLNILYFLLEANPSACSETYDGIKPIFVGGVHVDLLLPLLKNATKSELESLWEQHFMHYAASYMPSTQFDKMVEFTAAVTDINKILSTYDQFGQTPIHCALKCIHPVSMKTLMLCLNNPDLEPFSYAKHTRNSLLFVDMSHQPDKVQNFVTEKGVNFFIACAERENLLDAVTIFGNAQIVSAIWNHPKMDVLNGRKNGNSPLHLAALFYKANEFHKCVEKVVLKRRIDKLYLRNEDGYTPLHLAVARMEVQIKTMDLIICTGTPIYTLAKDNRTILETAYDNNRAETFIRSLKTRLELSPINPGVNINAQSMELSVLKSNELEQVLKQYLKNNKSVLAEITPVDLEFVSCLRTGNMFGKENIAKLERAWTIHERSKLIYAILIEDPNLYGPFVEALSLHYLPSTVNHLIDVIPFSQILQLRLNFHGNVHSLRELWLGMETQMWNALKQKLKINQVASIVRISLSEGTTIKVTKRSFLPALGLYKSRTLSRQIIVSQTFFTAESQNLFFFRGISLRDLSQMAVINSFAMSSTQITRVTTNFIYLEKDSHWTKISRKSNRPSYLCRYSKSLKAFVIEEVRNATDSFCQFPMGISTTGDNIITTTTREEELLSVLQLSSKSTIPSFGVVDLPGSGRSFLLRSLFERLIIRSPRKLVGFIYLPLMIAEMVSKHKLQVDSADDVRDSIIEYITTSRISAAFVLGLLEAGRIQIELFIDGLDDVADVDSEFGRKLVNTILGIDNIRTFISLLPTTYIQHFHGKIAAVYRLHPFSDTEQIDIFKHTHRKNTGVDTQLLDVQIQALLRKTRVDFKCSEFIGNPMRTRLVSEFITRGDLKHVHGTLSLLTSTYSAGMGFVSTKHKDTNSFVEDNISSTRSDLSEPNKVAENKQNMMLKIIALYHPKFFTEYSAPNHNQDTTNTSSNFNKLPMEGSIYEWIDLFNPTCKEYILSEFIKESLEMLGEITAETKPIHYKIFDFFLHRLLETIHLDPGSIETEPLTTELYCFRNPVLAVFHNEQLNSLYSTGNMHFELVSSCLRDMQPSALYRLLIAISYHDLSALMKLLKLSLDDLGAANLSMHKEYFIELVKPEGSCEQTRAVCLLSVACKHSSYALFSDLVATLDACFTVDVVTECLQTTKQQALNTAISLGKEQIAKIFFNRISKVDSRTLQSCIEYTTAEPSNIISTKLRILKILLSLSDKTAIESSLAHKMIDLDIIKRLTLAGADPSYSNNTTSNVLVSAASYMSAEKFHDLIDCLVALEKLPSLLKGIPDNPLHTILSTCININIKYFSKLVDVAQDQARVIDHDGNNLLIVAARENKPVEFMQMLQDKGAVIDTKNISSKNALHFASEWGNIETIKYILSLGLPINSTTDDGKTCLHYAGNSLETVLYLLNHGANISLRDKQQNNLLHFAAKEMDNDNFNKLIEHVLENYPTIAVKLFNNKNQIQRTPILERILSGKGMSFDVFRKLLSLEGLQLNARDAEGNSIIHGMARNKYPVSFLKDALDKGIGYKNVNKKGNNVLHETVAAGNTEYIKVLLPVRQALYRRNVNEETPIEMAYNILKNATDPTKIVLYNDIIHLLIS